jgi:hypothetical protein
LQFQQRANLLGDFLPQANHVFGDRGHFEGFLLRFFILDQAIDAIERHAAIVTDDATPPVGIWQPGDNAGVAYQPHVLGVGVKYAVVVGLAILGKNFSPFPDQVGNRSLPATFSQCGCRPEGMMARFNGWSVCKPDNLF